MLRFLFKGENINVNTNVFNESKQDDINNKLMNKSSHWIKGICLHALHSNNTTIFHDLINIVREFLLFLSLLQVQYASLKYIWRVPCWRWTSLFVNFTLICTHCTNVIIGSLFSLRNTSTMNSPVLLNSSLKLNEYLRHTIPDAKPVNTLHIRSVYILISEQRKSQAFRTWQQLYENTCL